MADFDETVEVSHDIECECTFRREFFQSLIQEVTDEEKLQIAQHYLLSSPPGQFNEVLTGLFFII